MDPKNELGQTIYNSRLALDLTQDEYGQRYSVSGPAIFKFEKGFVRPSLALWLKMAADTELTEKRAVILWLMCKLPEQYQAYVSTTPTHKRRKAHSGSIDYAAFELRAEMQAAAARDQTLPKALRKLLDDDEIWELFKPSGHEINLMRDMFGPMGKGSPADYREALRLIREFVHSF